MRSKPPMYKKLSIFYGVFFIQVILFPFLILGPERASNTDALLILDTLRPLLQIAIHRKNMLKMLGVTYVVPAPLTWKEFHRLAPRGLILFFLFI